MRLSDEGSRVQLSLRGERPLRFSSASPTERKNAMACGDVSLRPKSRMTGNGSSPFQNRASNMEKEFLLVSACVGHTDPNFTTIRFPRWILATRCVHPVSITPKVKKWTVATDRWSRGKVSRMTTGGRTNILVNGQERSNPLSRRDLSVVVGDLAERVKRSRSYHSRSMLPQRLGSVGNGYSDPNANVCQPSSRSLIA